MYVLDRNADAGGMWRSPYDGLALHGSRKSVSHPSTWHLWQGLYTQGQAKPNELCAYMCRVRAWLEERGVRFLFRTNVSKRTDGADGLQVAYVDAPSSSIPLEPLDAVIDARCSNIKVQFAREIKTPTRPLAAPSTLIVGAGKQGADVALARIQRGERVSFYSRVPIAYVRREALTSSTHGLFPALMRLSKRLTKPEWLRETQEMVREGILVNPCEEVAGNDGVEFHGGILHSKELDALRAGVVGFHRGECACARMEATAAEVEADPVAARYDAVVVCTGAFREAAVRDEVNADEEVHTMRFLYTPVISAQVFCAIGSRALNSHPINFALYPNRFAMMNQLMCELCETRALGFMQGALALSEPTDDADLMVGEKALLRPVPVFARTPGATTIRTRAADATKKREYPWTMASQSRVLLRDVRVRVRNGRGDPPHVRLDAAPELEVPVAKAGAPPPLRASAGQEFECDAAQWANDGPTLRLHVTAPGGGAQGWLRVADVERVQDAPPVARTADVVECFQRLIESGLRAPYVQACLRTLPDRTSKEKVREARAVVCDGLRDQVLSLLGFADADAFVSSPAPADADEAQTRAAHAAHARIVKLMAGFDPRGEAAQPTRTALSLQAAPTSTATEEAAAGDWKAVILPGADGSVLHLRATIDWLKYLQWQVVPIDTADFCHLRDAHAFVDALRDKVQSSPFVVFGYSNAGVLMRSLAADAGLAARWKGLVLIEPMHAFLDDVPDDEHVALTTRMLASSLVDAAELDARRDTDHQYWYTLRARILEVFPTYAPRFDGFDAWRRIGESVPFAFSAATSSLVPARTLLLVAKETEPMFRGVTGGDACIPVWKALCPKLERIDRVACAHVDMPYTTAAVCAGVRFAEAVRRGEVDDGYETRVAARAVADGGAAAKVSQVLSVMASARQLFRTKWAKATAGDA